MKLLYLLYIYTIFLFSCSEAITEAEEQPIEVFEQEFNPLRYLEALNTDTTVYLNTETYDKLKWSNHIDYKESVRDDILIQYDFTGFEHWDSLVCVVSNDTLFIKQMTTIWDGCSEVLYALDTKYGNFEIR